MKWRPTWSTVTIVLALIAALAIASPVLGLSKSIKKSIKKEVSKQLANATGPAGPPGTNGTNGADGTARAYGLVDGTGVSVSRSKNVAGVTRPSTGTYCIALAAGIDADQTGLVATPDFSGDTTGTGNTTHVEWDSSGGGCPAGRLQVLTYRVDTSGTTPVADPQGGTVNAPVYTNTFVNQDFFFVVP